MRIGLFLLAVVMVAGMVGCGGGSTGPSSYTADDLQGTYTITSSTDTPTGGSTQTTDYTGSLILTSSGTFSVTVNYTNTTESGTGTYTVNGTKIVLIETGYDPMNMTISNNGKTITSSAYGLNDGGHTTVLVFTKS